MVLGFNRTDESFIAQLLSNPGSRTEEAPHCHSPPGTSPAFPVTTEVTKANLGHLFFHYVKYFLCLQFSNCECENLRVESLKKQNFCLCCLWPVVAHSSYLEAHVLFYGYMPSEVAVGCTCPDISAASQLAFNQVRCSLLHASIRCIQIDFSCVDSS